MGNGKKRSSKIIIELVEKLRRAIFPL